jgi:hypothetical protein
VQRREFLVSAIAAWGVPRFAQPPAHVAETSWKTFDITTQVHVQNASGKTRLWLPTPLAVAPYQKTLGDTYQIDHGSAAMVEREGIDVLLAEWPDGADPILTLTSRVATIEHAIDLATPAVPPPKDFAAFSPFLRAMPAPPLDEAAVKAAAARVVRQAGTDLDHARAIYESVAGRPDAITGFVALARAAGVPARVVHGLRLSAAEATRAQVDRAEAYLVGYGWIPVDAPEKRFGSWDMRWVAYNAAQDVALPNAATRGLLPAFMHPHAETGGRRLDPLEPDRFRYSIGVEVVQ